MRMKILELIPTLIDGGAERFVTDLCNELTDQNEVLLCSMFPLKDNNSFFKDELTPSIRLISLNKKKGIDIVIIRKLQRLINEFQPDIIHTHVRALNYLLPLLLLPAKKYKVVHTVHNSAWKEVANAKERKFRYWFYRQKKVIPVTISKDSEATFKEAYPGVFSSVIYNGSKMPVPGASFEEVKEFVEKQKKNPNTKVFVHIGRLIPQKNHLMLIAAFNRLLQDNPNAILLLIGGARNTFEGDKIATKVQEACNENIIWLGGNQPATDYLMLGDFFCLSSLYEGMPISLIEACSVGCIPVCTPVGGIREMIEGVGFLAKDVSEDAYYEALKTASNYPVPELIKLKEKLNLLYIEKYTIKICAKKYENLFLDLVN